MISFFFLSIIILSLFTIFSSNPVNAIIFLIIIFFETSIIFFVFNLDYLGIILIILYVGAIAVLFLFIVMMLNIKNIEKDNTSYLLIGFFFFFLIFFQFCNFITNNFLHFFFNLDINLNFFNYLVLDFFDELLKYSFIYILSVILFIEYPILFILFSFFLLIALISCIVLGNFKTGFSVRKQYNQFYRNYSIINFYIY